ncbi:MAG: hypothetical protein A2V67_10200 [Deltaproteobacteria bacterium RBG_13_61_14]|nr:MAG: hypothetical protein A2V67_10200 [Deltaproteobacteria bacterium RBG_13_61_14]
MNQETSQISNELYIQLLQGIELEHILLVQSNSKFFPNKKGEPGNIILQENKKCQIAPDKKKFNVFHEFEVIGSVKIDEKLEKMFEIKGTLLFDFSSREEVSEGFLDLFLKRNFGIFSIPYIREYIQSAASRMGIPQLIMPLVKPQIIQPNK